METKTCTKCNTVKSLSDFSTKGLKKDGTPKYQSWCKRCKTEYQAGYHAVNRTKILAYQKEYRLTNKEELSQKDRERRDRNRERRAEINAAWRAKNTEVIKDKRREDYQRNKESYLTANRRRRARLADAFVEDVYTDSLTDRDGDLCSYCGEMPLIVHLDHIVALDRDGLNNLDNLAISCEPCNESKGAKPVHEFIAFRERLGKTVILSPYVVTVMADLEAGTNLEMYQKINGEIRHPRYMNQLADTAA